ncbi:MAG TPA: hypothetical protein VJP60_07025 [Rhizomicrobium sp.]|nr:hypothetical protein [Rhizomicrobium sp.]
MSIYVGVGGWVYPEWRDNFYPFAAAGCKPDKSILRIDLSSERAEHERGAMT